MSVSRILALLVLSPVALSCAHNEGNGTYESASKKVAAQIPETDPGPLDGAGLGETRPISPGKVPLPPDDGADDTLVVGTAVLERKGTAIRGGVSLGDTPNGPRVAIELEGAAPGQYHVELAAPGLNCDQVLAAAPLPVPGPSAPVDLLVAAGRVGELLVGADGRARYATTLHPARVPGGIRGLARRIIFLVPATEGSGAPVACGAIALTRANPPPG
jgi:hypothetical protein